MIKKKKKKMKSNGKKETEEEEEENDDFGEVRALLLFARERDSYDSLLSPFFISIYFIFKRAARCLFATKTDFFIYSPPHLIKQNKTNRHKERERKSAGN